MVCISQLKLPIENRIKVNADDDENRPSFFINN